MRRSLLHSLYFICIALVFFISCSVSKRVYRKGYHVVWDHKRTEAHEKIARSKNEQKNEVPSEKVEKVIVASLETEVELLGEVKRSSLILGKDTCGDVMIFKNGEKLSVKIVEVDGARIKYKRCDNIDGPVFVTRKKALSKLTYFNGAEENLEYVEEKKDNEDRIVIKPNDPFATTALTLAITGFFLGFTLPLALIFAFASANRFKKEPDKYDNRWFALTALIVTLVLSTGFCVLYYFVFLESLATIGLPICFAIFALLAIFGIVIFPKKSEKKK